MSKSDFLVGSFLHGRRHARPQYRWQLHKTHTAFHPAAGWHWLDIVALCLLPLRSLHYHYYPLAVSELLSPVLHCQFRFKLFLRIWHLATAL